MEKTFLYIDILGFKNLVTNNTDKVESIFKIIDSLHVHKDIAFQTIVFSDTILIFNKDNRYPLHFYVTYLIRPFSVTVYVRIIYVAYLCGKLYVS